MIPNFLVPFTLILLVFLVLPRKLLKYRSSQWTLIFACLVVVSYYLHWRLTLTVLPANLSTFQGKFVWALFFVEVFVWVDTVIALLTVARRTDRSAEADLHERRLRLTAPHHLPSVDVLITTYNEPFEVLEKTVVGALALDWPTDRLNIYVLDDGRRDWVREFCGALGVTWLTRENNDHAKAGNINAAIPQISGEFFMVLDADFVPQRNFLFRAMGFFEDSKIGIVQVPHNFFNSDPMQTSLQMQAHMPDDQRFFFDTIMPGRDGWNCAFCCGSNSITRRTAILAAGGKLPTGSITEDMLLTLLLIRHGFITRYLNERLAIGLAAESLSGFFVQRSRWARGALQILYDQHGPLTPGLRWHQRMLFLPTHWLSSSLGHVVGLLVPIIYLWTGLNPMLNVDAKSILNYQIPAILAPILAFRLLAPGQFFPLAATAHGMLMAFRLLPLLIVTLVKPWGHKFQVTPKGNDTASSSYNDWFTIGICIALVIATVLGLFINSQFEHAIIDSMALIPIVAFWSIWNVMILLVVMTIAVSPPRIREEERFMIDEQTRLVSQTNHFPARISDLSLSGALVSVSSFLNAENRLISQWFLLEIPEVGFVPANVKRVRNVGERAELGLEFYLPHGEIRKSLIRKLFTSGRDNSTHTRNGFYVALKVIKAVFRVQPSGRIAERPEQPKPPLWIINADASIVEETWARVASEIRPHADRQFFD